MQLSFPTEGARAVDNGMPIASDRAETSAAGRGTTEVVSADIKEEELVPHK